MGGNLEMQMFLLSLSLISNTALNFLSFSFSFSPFPPFYIKMQRGFFREDGEMDQIVDGCLG